MIWYQVEEDIDGESFTHFFKLKENAIKWYLSNKDNCISYPYEIDTDRFWWEDTEE